MHVRAVAAAVMLLTGLLITSCSGPSGVRRADVQPRVSRDALEKRIHDLVNAERTKKGLRPLAWDRDLARIARNHSSDMVDRNFFSHHDPEGCDVSGRHRRGGYRCDIRIGNATCYGAENISRNSLYRMGYVTDGRTSYDWYSEDEVARDVVRSWMKSKGHRENILTPYFRKQGIGIAVDRKGQVFVTENFC